jgi:hypothetical protein
MNIFLIKLIKKLNIWSYETYETYKTYDSKDIYNYKFLKENGYECDIDLSINNKYIVIYYNKNTYKLIVYLDGVDKEFENYLLSFNLFKCKNLFDEYTDRIKKTVNIINQKYNNYEKLYIGYCLGGYMLNNYVNGQNIKAYTYNCFGIKHNSNNIPVINYCQELDLQNSYWKLDKNSKVINSHNKYLMDQFLNLYNINLYDLFSHFHVVNTVNDEEISIEF